MTCRVVCRFQLFGTERAFLGREVVVNNALTVTGSAQARRPEPSFLYVLTTTGFDQLLFVADWSALSLRPLARLKT